MLLKNSLSCTFNLYILNFYRSFSFFQYIVIGFKCNVQRDIRALHGFFQGKERRYSHETNEKVQGYTCMVVLPPPCSDNGGGTLPLHLLEK